MSTYAVALWVAYRSRIRGNVTRLRLTALTHSHMPFDPNLDKSGCVREVIDLACVPNKDKPFSELNVSNINPNIETVKYFGFIGSM